MKALAVFLALAALMIVGAYLYGGAMLVTHGMG
jgi:hypothetical protein